MAKPGERLFTQFSFHYEKGHHLTTNYRRGILVPINTQVEFVDADRKSITVSIADYGGTVRIENVKDFSGEDIEGIFNRMFARARVDLDRFNELERGHIAHGTVAVGMSKDAVLRGYGYPPRHKTPTLTLKAWRYWESRFDTVLIAFDDEDRVSEIRD